MSEFTHKYTQKVENLSYYIIALSSPDAKGKQLLEKYKILDFDFSPEDVLIALDTAMNSNLEMENLKTASNKLFNILYKHLIENEKRQYLTEPFLRQLVKDNIGVKKHMSGIRAYIKEINKKQNNQLLGTLKKGFEEMLRFTQHYILIQNIVFPYIEKYIPPHACLQLMWAFHDDIAENIKQTIELLDSEKFDLKKFNKISSKVYFNISTILFREEYVLFPVLYKYATANDFSQMIIETEQFPLEYAPFSKTAHTTNSNTYISSENVVELSTGKLSLEQLEMIFSHLPVDMTYVDENDEVKFFSNPKHRIFPRTRSIIGRKVQNCHPHDSVHIVNKIVEAFRKGEKNEAAFWLQMGQKFVLIKYFAVHDQQGNYRGVLEVSQEVSEIRGLTGERRLLDW